MDVLQSRSVFRVALLIAGLASGVSALSALAQAPMLGVSPTLTKYVDPLPVPPAATPKLLPVVSQVADFYEIAMTQHQHQFH